MPSLTSLRDRRNATVAASLAVAVLAVGGSAAYARTRASTTAAPAGPQQTTRVVAASLGTLRQTVSMSGTVAPADEEDLSFGASGRVTSVAVTVGQKVSKGQQLATIDSASLRAAVASAQATVANDQAKVSDDASSSTATAAQKTADAASLTAAQAQLADAQAALAAASMSSPIDGTVTAVNLTVGQQVAGGAGGSAGSGGAGSGQGSGGGSTSSGTAQVVVVSTGRFVVNATADASTVSRLKAGLQAVVSPSGDSKTYFGTVKSVGLVPSTTSGAPQFPVVVDLTGTQTGLYGGSSATVDVVVKQLQNVLEVPAQAVHYDGSSATVTVDSNGQRSSRPVQVGDTVNGMTQVVSGLKQGEDVVYTTFVFPGRTNSSGTAGGGQGTGRGAGGAGFGGGGFGGGFGGGLQRGGAGGFQRGGNGGGQ
ncbi:MAG: efflux RND transporter periplasmic adaptor subunit [Motilibacteraceae bacterium]